jgi:WD40 repeat protein
MHWGTGRLIAGFGLCLAWVRWTAPAGEKPQGDPERTDLYGDPLPDGAVARLGTTRLRHADAIVSLACSPDGKTLASASKDHTLRLWDAATGKELHRYAEGAESAAFSPDGKTLAAGDAQFIRLYDVATGEEIRRWQWAAEKPSPFGVAALGFSPDGDTVISLHHDQSETLVRRWDLNGRETAPLKGHERPVCCAAFSPDGKTIASGAEGEGLRLWDAAFGREVAKFSMPRVCKSTVTLSPDGKTVALVGLGCDVYVCAIPSGEVRLRLDAPPSPVKALAFSRDGATLRLVGDDGVVVRWDVKTGKEQGRLRAEGVESTGVAPAVSADGTTAAFVGFDHTIVRWDLEGDRPLNPFEDHGYGGGVLVAVSPDGATVATCGRRVCLWNAADGRLVRRFDAPSVRPRAMAYSPDGRFIATDDFADLVVWDVKTGRPHRRVEKHRCSPDGLAFVSGGKRLAVLRNWGESIDLLDPDTGEEVRTIDLAPDSASWLAASPAGAVAAAGVEGRWVRLWDVETGKPLERLSRELTTGFGMYGVFAFSPDGRILAYDTHVNEISLWDVSGGKSRPTKVERSLPNGGLAISPDGKTLAVGVRGGIPGKWPMAGLWETATGRFRRSFQDAAAGACVSMAFAQNGRLLVTGGDDGTALVWDVTSLSAEGRARLGPLGAEGWGLLWDDLVADEDGLRAYEALCRLTADPPMGLAVLRERLHPAPAPGRRLSRALEDLDSDDFEVREKASDELAEMGEAIRPALQRAAEKSPSAEVRQRAAFLLNRLGGRAFVAEGLRRSRAVEALERMGTPEARDLLKELAGGADGAPLTRNAEAALKRLAKKPADP